MSKENKLIPELRFPEFANDGEWREIKLKQFGTFYRGLTYGADDTANKGLLVLRSGNIQNDTLVLDRDLVFVDKECPNDLKLLKGDIVICMSNGSKSLVGKNTEYKGEYDGNITVGAFCSIMRPKNKFTKYFLQSDAYQNFIALSIGGGNINNFKNSDLEEFKCSAPIKPREQQKIASCLSSLDAVIAAYRQKLELLKDHKKGLMQNLFPQERETVPKHRFPEFKNNDEWVTKKLGDKEVSYFVNEKTSVNKLNIDSYISTENMLPEFSGVSTASKLPSLGSFTKFKNGDILISNIRPYLKKVWKADKIGGASNDVLVFRSGSEVLSEFLECIIKNEAFINYVMESVKGVKMPRGDKDSMQKYKVLIPSRTEQQKIASCLSSLDVLIAAQVDKIEQLKLHKKGLMQGLFPKMN